MRNRPTQEWNRFTIKAELYQRGMTLKGVALDAGLSESRCRRALLGYDRKGAQAIADALDIPLEVLFPNNYNLGRHHRGQTNRNERDGGSAKSLDRADADRGLA